MGEDGRITQPVVDRHAGGGQLEDERPGGKRVGGGRRGPWQQAVDENAGAHELRELLLSRPAVGQDRQLTARQVDVVALVALGLTNEAIASRLGLSTLTVKSYLRSAMARLDAQTRYQAVIEARRLGILPLGLIAARTASWVTES